MSEKLSALIDNELDELERARLLKELGRGSDLVELWSRYHVIGLAMRREEVSWRDGLPARVAEALQLETGVPEQNGTAVRRRALSGSVQRFAVAASVAGVLLVGGLIVNLYQGSQPVSTTTLTGQQVAFSNDATRWDSVDPQVEDALNTLLVEHSEFTSASGMNGLTAYTKFVAYDSR